MRATNDDCVAGRHTRTGVAAQTQACAAELNTITYNVSISACEKGSQWLRAQGLLA